MIAKASFGASMEQEIILGFEQSSLGPGLYTSKLVAMVHGDLAIGLPFFFHDVGRVPLLAVSATGDPLDEVEEINPNPEAW